MSGRLMGRVALVTGASRGIGHAAAMALAREGATVIAAARSLDGLQDLQTKIESVGSNCICVPVDLMKCDDIVRLGQLIAGRFDCLDILVGNAGVLGPVVPLTEVSPDDWQEALAINLTANFHLIRACDALLRRSIAGRVLFVSSGVSAMARANWGAYSVSKAALELLARTYAAETAGTNVRVNVLTPGPIRTQMYAVAVPGVDMDTLAPPEHAASIIVDMCLPEFIETGKIYNNVQKKLLSFRPPA